MEKPLRLNKHFFGVVLGAFLSACGTDEPILTIQREVLLNAVEEGKISVIAPASWIEEEEEIHLKKQYPVLWHKVQDQFAPGYDFLSNSDGSRFNFLIKEATNESSRFIWTLRGGYGSGRLIPSLLKIPEPLKEKRFIGYSDITSLHLFVSQTWGWKPIHGAVFKEILDKDKDPKNFQYLEEIISGKTSCITYPGLRLLNKKSIHKISGKLTGGNATLLSMSAGTPWQLNAKDKIILIEESGHGDRIDRTLQHLRNTKLLDNATAIIIGEIIGWDMNASKLIDDFIQNLDVPVFKASFFGHGRRNYPWVYNADAIIEPSSDNDYQLSFDIN